MQVNDSDNSISRDARESFFWKSCRGSVVGIHIFGILCLMIGGVLAFTPVTAADPVSPKPSSTGSTQPAVLAGPGPHAANSEFTYQFLGKVKAYAREETVEFQSSAGTVAKMSLKVYYTEQGQFIRAEFVRPGAPDWQATPENLEISARSHHEIITGLSPTPLRVPLRNILESVVRSNLALENASRFNVNYVQWRYQDEPPVSVILVNVFGVTSPVMDLFPDRDGFQRCRVVIGDDGKVQFLDNGL